MYPIIPLPRGIEKLLDLRFLLLGYRDGAASLGQLPVVLLCRRPKFGVICLGGFCHMIVLADLLLRRPAVVQVAEGGVQHDPQSDEQKQDSQDGNNFGSFFFSAFILNCLPVGN